MCPSFGGSPEVIRDAFANLFYENVDKRMRRHATQRVEAESAGNLRPPPPAPPPHPLPFPLPTPPPVGFGCSGPPPPPASGLGPVHPLPLVSGSLAPPLGSLVGLASEPPALQLDSGSHLPSSDCALESALLPSSFSLVRVGSAGLAAAPRSHSKAAQFLERGSSLPLSCPLYAMRCCPPPIKSGPPFPSPPHLVLRTRPLLGSLPWPVGSAFNGMASFFWFWWTCHG